MDDKAALPATKEEAVAVVRAGLREELRSPELTIDEHEPLELLPGADSVRLMRVVAELERKFDIEFDDERIHAAETVRDLSLLLLELSHNRS